MKSFAVIGCGRFGSSVATTLYHMGHEVMAVDSNEELVQSISEDVTHAVVVDVMDEIAVGELGLSNFDIVIVSIGSNVEASIMATIMAKEHGVKRVVAKATSDFQGKILAKVGADKVIYPERDMGVRLAHNLVSTNIIEFIELSPDYGIIEINPPKEWINKTLTELDLHSKHGINVIAIRSGEKININPERDYLLEKDDLLVIVASTLAINKLEKKAGN